MVYLKDAALRELFLVNEFLGEERPLCFFTWKCHGELNDACSVTFFASIYYPLSRDLHLHFILYTNTCKSKLEIDDLLSFESFLEKKAGHIHIFPQKTQNCNWVRSGFAGLFVALT